MNPYALAALVVLLAIGIGLAWWGLAHRSRDNIYSEMGEPSGCDHLLLPGNGTCIRCGLPTGRNP